MKETCQKEIISTGPQLDFTVASNYRLVSGDPEHVGPKSACYSSKSALFEFQTVFSTNAFKSCKALSHCAAMTPKYSCKDSSGFGSSSYKLSRPVLKLETSPTFSSTVRCLVMACLVTLVPVVSDEMEWGFPSISFATNDNRVGSPRAAKIFACCSVLAVARSLLLDKKGLDILKLGFPSAGVHFKSFGATARGHFIKSRLFDFHECASHTFEIDALISICRSIEFSRFVMRNLQVAYYLRAA